MSRKQKVTFIFAFLILLAISGALLIRNKTKDEQASLGALDHQILMTKSLPAELVDAELNTKLKTTDSNPIMPMTVDVCPNLSGLQMAVPAGYQIVNGQCVQADLCPNIVGDQAAVPTGYQVIGGKCYRITLADVPVTVSGKPKLPLLPTSPSRVCTDSETGFATSNMSYMIGGHNRSTGFADFFSFKTSPTAWTQIMNSLPFGDKSHHGMAIFQNKLWIAGGVHTGNIPQSGNYAGFSGYTSSNQIWTYDGFVWNQEPLPAWSPRYDHSVVVFQNKLWVMGGSNFMHGALSYLYPLGQLFGDMWVFDGLQWSRFDADTSTIGIQDAPWTTPPTPPAGEVSILGRSAFKTAVFQNKLWLMGGIQGYEKYQSGNLSTRTTITRNDVWSFDGAAWTNHGNALWVERSDFVLIPFQNKLWFMGGEKGNQVYNDVWSFDGTSWTSHGNAPWAPRGQFVGMVQNAKLYIMGGDDNTNLLNDVWSFDGVTWTMVDNVPGTSAVDNALWSVRDGMSIVTCP